MAYDFNHHSYLVSLLDVGSYLSEVGNVFYHSRIWRSRGVNPVGIVPRSLAVETVQSPCYYVALAE